jgi:autotransporter passenger strand-loop-strand repeat protein
LAKRVMINDGAEWLVADGETDTGTVGAGGILDVGAGGSAVDFTVAGNETVLSGGGDDSALIVNGGVQTIQSGGIANNTTVGTGGTEILPVCIQAGALGANMPARDLWISPHHAMYFSDHGGVLIEAKDLVNGVSIVQAHNVEKVEYFHIELDSHDVIIAEGALSETFLDDNSRGMFHNAYEYETLYVETHSAPVQYCAPRCQEGYEVEAVRRRIASRAGLAIGDGGGKLRGYVDAVRGNYVKGWAQNVEHPEAPVCLDIFANGELVGQVLANRYREDLAKAGLGSGRHSFVFRLPVGVTLTADAVEVRRSHDGTCLEHSHPEKMSA